MKKIIDKLTSDSISASLMMFMRPSIVLHEPTMSGLQQDLLHTLGQFHLQGNSSLHVLQLLGAGRPRAVEKKKSAVRQQISQAIEYILLADEVDPGESGVQRNLKAIKEVLPQSPAAQFPTTRALKEKLSTAKSRTRRVRLSLDSARQRCHFCETNPPEESCCITVPICGKAEKVALIFGEGLEYPVVDTGAGTAPPKWLEEHSTLPSRIEQWHTSRLASEYRAFSPVGSRD